MIGAGTPRRLHVLVVGSDAVAAHSAGAALAGSGFRVSLAFDGEDALAVNRDDPADVLVTELAMPRLDGHTLLRRMRAAKAHLPVLVMAASPPPGGSEALSDGRPGPLVLLRKPIGGPDLVAAVRTTAV